MNILDIMKNLMSTNTSPKQFLMKTMLENNQNPIIHNLIDIAEKGDNKGIEDFARNYFKEKGRNFDDEYAKFMKMVNKR